MTRKQNLTVQLDPETIRGAKILAAKRGTSVSRMLAQQIRESVASDEQYDAARRLALELLARGFHLGGTPVKREELHDR